MEKNNSSNNQDKNFEWHIQYKTLMTEEEKIDSSFLPWAGFFCFVKMMVSHLMMPEAFCDHGNRFL